MLDKFPRPVDRAEDTNPVVLWIFLISVSYMFLSKQLKPYSCHGQMVKVKISQAVQSCNPYMQLMIIDRLRSHTFTG